MSNSAKHMNMEEYMNIHSCIESLNENTPVVLYVIPVAHSMLVRHQKPLSWPAEQVEER